MLVDFGQKVVFFSKCVNIYVSNYFCIYFNANKENGGTITMKHIQTINKANLSATAKKGGCGKCQASCQSACKTSCTVGNQKCANEDNK